MTATEAVFETNPNKDFVRAQYDKALIEQWCARAGRRLKYLGLPAWRMLDIIEWQQFLDRFTTIERDEDQQHLLILRANVKEVEHRLFSLYGEFDEILLSGRDRFGKTPEWPYDLVNLDYFGGFYLFKSCETQGAAEIDSEPECVWAKLFVDYYSTYPGR